MQRCEGQLAQSHMLGSGRAGNFTAAFLEITWPGVFT